MSTHLYWQIKQSAKNELPIKLKWELEYSHQRDCPDVNWLKGYCSALERDEEKEQINALIAALEDGHEVELQWR